VPISEDQCSNYLPCLTAHRRIPPPKQVWTLRPNSGVAKRSENRCGWACLVLGRRLLRDRARRVAHESRWGSCHSQEPHSPFELAVGAEVDRKGW